MATRALTPRSPAYDHDGFGWAQAQAELLRARRWSEIDIANIAEEIESVGRSEYDKLESALRILLVHLLKWAHQPERQSRSWALTIREQRLRYAKTLARNPSLKPHLPQIVADAYEEARIGAALETGLDDTAFPAACPFDMDDILTGDRTPPAPR